MVTRFGSREICDVTFKALTNNQKVGNNEFKAGQPVFVIDTATASNMEQATTTVYAQGGRGYNRLIAWEGEKTLTFTVTDALMSPLGLAVLTGAGFAEEDATKHIHVSYDVAIGSDGVGHIKAKDLAGELGISVKSAIQVCNDPDLVPYGMVLDGNGAIRGWVDEVVFLNDEDPILDNIIVISGDQTLDIQATEGAGNTVKVDFYVRMTTGATEITIRPDDFGGFFYVEADTLYRNQDGKDMAATLTFPKVKIQSAFTLAMAPTGDPSTFDFVMDAMPAYTYFDHTQKVVCDITVVSHTTGEKAVTGVTKLTTAPDDVNKEKSQANQNAISIAKNGDTYEVKVNKIIGAEGADGLNTFTSTNEVQARKGNKEWVGIFIDTGDRLTNITWNGTALGEEDIAEAQSVGAKDDKTIIFWTPYEELPKSVKVGTVDGTKETVTVKFAKG